MVGISTTTSASPRITPWRALTWLAAFLVIYPTGQWLLTAGIINGYLYLILVQICIFIIAAVSLNLINGITGQFSLGHAGFMTVGGYMAAVATTFWGLPFPVALLFGALCAGVLGFLVGMPTLRLKGDYLAIATLGMGEIIRVVFENIEPLGGASGFTAIPRPSPLLHIGSKHYGMWGWSLLCTVLVLFVIRQFIDSSHGRACVAVREDELAAETMGINTTYFKVLAFTIGAMCAGVAGGLLAHDISTIAPDSAGFLNSVAILVIVVLGGLGSLTGSAVAAALLTIVNALTSSFTNWRMIIYALLLIVLMIFLPQGVWQGGALLWRRLRWPWARPVGGATDAP